MVERLYLKVVWGDRRQTLGLQAKKATAFLNDLALLDKAFMDWHIRGTSRDEVLANKLSVNESEILSKFQLQQDIKQKSASLGNSRVSLSLWNGREGDGAIGLSVAGGAETGRDWPQFNYCDIDLPHEAGAVTNRLTCFSNLQKLFQKVVEHWDPDWGYLSTGAISNAAYEPTYSGAFAGWLTYLSDRYGSIPQLPKSFTTNTFLNLGTIITINDVETWTSQDLRNVTVVKQLTVLLREAGLLLPKSPVDKTNN